MNRIAGAGFGQASNSGSEVLGRPGRSRPSPKLFTVIRLTRSHGGTTYLSSQETKELAMDANRSGHGEYTARQDFLIRVTIAVVLFYGFLVTVSLLPTNLS
jgi:hypothetical protein